MTKNECVERLMEEGSGGVESNITELSRFILFHLPLLPPRNLLHGVRDNKGDRVQEGVHPFSKSASANPADTVVQADDSIDV